MHHDDAYTSDEPYWWELPTPEEEAAIIAQERGDAAED